MKRAKKSIIIIGRFELIFDSRVPLRSDDINVLFCVSILLNKKVASKFRIHHHGYKNQRDSPPDGQILGVQPHSSDIH
jgi:hypothetical protein